MVKKLLFKRKDATGKINPTPKVSNSGKLVYEILDKKEREENLSDFSNFPKKAEKIENISLEQMTSCGFNNLVSAFYSKTQLNEDFGISDISLLKNKYIAYEIILDNGKWYFGSTKDIGERIHTHLKDFRGGHFNKELANDAKKYKRILFLPLAILKTEQESKEKENKLIVDFAYKRFREITNGEEPSHYSWSEIRQYTKKYIYNKIKAIAIY